MTMTERTGPETVKRPLSITIGSWFFIALGGVTLVAGLLPAASGATPEHPETLLELSLVCAVRLVAVLGGAFMLRGRNWARWLLVAWVAFHLGISSLHSVFALMVHAGLFGIILYLLFRRAASAYFRSRRMTA